MANEKNITLDNLKTFKAKADATYAKKTDITTSCIYVGKASEKSNSATTNGNTYLKLFDNDTKRSQHLINGGGATTVTSNASGTITVATPIKNLDTTSSSGLGAGSENIAGSGTVYLHKVAKTGSYNDLVNKPTIPTIPTNLVTTNTEQHITGKKYLETEIGFGKYISPVRAVSDAPANLVLMNFQNRNAGFFDAIMFAGAGDWLYLGHLKPTFSIKASFKGNGEESDTYSASLGYTRGWLDYLTDWDYQNGWLVRPTKVSATTPAIIQIKFTTMLYTDVLRLILTGHNLNDSSGNYSGFLDDYTIEVCTDYAKDTWTTVVNRTNANDNIGKGLIYAMQTGSYTTCYGIRLKITKCHVNGNGFAYIKITSMQLRDYRPGFKFPDCLGAISQGGGDVWGALNTNNNLMTHAVFPEATNSYNLGSPTQQYYGAYASSFYENGTAISDKYLAKGTSSTNVSQDVWGELHTKSNLVTHHVYPEVANSYILGSPNYPYAEIYGNNFYEGGTALSDKYLAKGYLERISPKLFRHTIKIEGYSERTTGTALVCMLQVDSSFSRAVDSFAGLATVLGSIDKETGEPGVQSSCKVSGGIVIGEGNLDYIIPLIRLETDGTVNHTVFVSLINEYPDLSEDVDSRFGHLSDYSTVTYTDSVTPVS